MNSVKSLVTILSVLSSSFALSNTGKLCALEEIPYYDSPNQKSIFLYTDKKATYQTPGWESKVVKCEGEESPVYLYQIKAEKDKEYLQFDGGFYDPLPKELSLVGNKVMVTKLDPTKPRYR